MPTDHSMETHTANPLKGNKPTNRLNIRYIEAINTWKEIQQNSNNGPEIGNLLFQTGNS